MRISARIERPGGDGPFDIYYRGAVQRMEHGALVVTDRARRRAQARIRTQMQGAGLGRLGNAIGSTSDLEQGHGVRRTGAEGFSASGTVYIRSRSPRTLGAVEAYTEGADITPRRSRWLWIATDEIPRVANRERMTPALYRQNGFDRKIGPLIQIRSINGNPLLIVRNVGVSEVGLPRKAKALRKDGGPRKGQRLKEFVVAFVGIPRTSRAARVDVRAILRAEQATLPDEWHNEMRKRRRD